jgi:hypothetical protein
MHGPNCVFWTNLTPFSLQHRRLLGDEGDGAGATMPDACIGLDTVSPQHSVGN